MSKLEKYYSSVENLLSKEEIENTAKQFSAEDKRKRKMPIDIFFWTTLLVHNTDLMFGGLKEAVSRFRNICLISCGNIINISTMAVSKKLSKKDWNFFRYVFEKFVNLYPVEVSSILSGVLLKLEKVEIIDSTAIKVFKMLQNKFPSTEKEVAKLKIHTKHDLKRNIPKEIKITAQKTNDKEYDFVSKSEKDILYIFDLGYWSFKLFDKIIDSFCFFVSRLRADSNPIIISENSKINGKLLQEILKNTELTTIDFKCHLSKYRSNPMKNDVRLVGIKVEDKWHLYITNLYGKEFTPEIISKIYTLRWQIEIFFNELKHMVNLNRIFSHNENGIMIEIYASLIYYTITEAAIIIAAEEAGKPIEYYSFINSARIVRDILSVYKWMPKIKNFSEVLKLITSQINIDGLKDGWYINKKIKPFFKKTKV